MPFQTPNNATNQAHKPVNTTTHTNNHTVIGGHVSKPPPRGFLMPTIHPQTNKQKLLRKEVIQPHLPVRLPCYDFVPIADPTFDGSLHKGWATGFGCYRLS